MRTLNGTKFDISFDTGEIVSFSYDDLKSDIDETKIFHFPEFGDPDYRVFKSNLGTNFYIARKTYNSWINVNLLGINICSWNDNKTLSFSKTFNLCPFFEGKTEKKFIITCDNEPEIENIIDCGQWLTVKLV